MKSSAILALSFLTCISVSLRAQDTFQNFDFESATLGNGTWATNLLTSWSAFSGTNQLLQIPYNAVLFAPEVGLYGSNSVVISGSFSVSLSGGGSVSQAGLVPADARLLLFKGRWSDVVPVLVSLNGQEVAYTTFSTSPNYTAYVADVLAFAGQSATLRFSALSSGFYVIDDVEFAVPEPSALALLGLGGVCLLTGTLKRRRVGGAS